MSPHMTPMGDGTRRAESGPLGMELFVIKQIRVLKTLHPSSILFGQRIATLTGLEWGEPLKQLLGELVQKKWLTFTELGGYAPNEWTLSHVGPQFETGHEDALTAFGMRTVIA